MKLNSDQSSEAKHGWSRQGYSLPEMLVVLLVLSATAVLLTPFFQSIEASPDEVPRSASEITTQSSMTLIRDALIGEEGVLENMAHRPDALPREISELVQEEAPTHVRQELPDLSKFNAYLGQGWRGPYLPPTGKNNQGKPTLVDGWGREFVLQVNSAEAESPDSDSVNYIRVVSAGPNGKIETPLAEEPDTISSNEGDVQVDYGDDLVMFLVIPFGKR